jgi:hypothetical protein
VEPKEFYIFWSGALRANHTGRYEIVVRSTCSFKLRFGTYDNVLINNHVQSEGKTEFRRTLNLISGRPYQIKIDFTQRKRKTEQPPATFSLRWVPPGGVETVIPPENLIPSSLPSSFALQTKLPPDDRSYGYDRGTRVDPQWDQAVTNAALEFGVAAEEELWPHYRKKHRKESDENRGRLRSFLEELVSIAFREPLDDATRKLYIDRQLDAAPDDGEAIRRVCLLTIKSPRFLYPLVDRDASQSQRVANRLSLVLHDSLPVDDWLLKQIEKGEFKLESGDGIEKIRQAAQKLANDPRLNGKAMEMFFDWLEIDPAAEIVKDPEKYDGFDAALQNGLRRSLERQVSDIFWSSESDYRELFLRDWTWTNPMLATFYGDQWKQSGEDSAEYEMVRSDSNPGKTFGVLTHPLVLSHLSYFDTTSPIHRGVFLIRRVLGRTLRPPNEAFTPINPDLHPDLTTRQRVELQTGEAKCQVCHEKINGLGFVLENYDTVGRFREFEKEKPIDATGSYVTRSGQRVTFNSVKDLAKFLAENKDAHRAFVERVFEHFAKQPLAAYGEDAADRLVSQFRKDFHMRHLIVEVAVLAATQPLIEEQQNGDQHESA